MVICRLLVLGFLGRCLRLLLGLPGRLLTLRLVLLGLIGVDLLLLLSLLLLCDLLRRSCLSCFLLFLFLGLFLFEGALLLSTVLHQGLGTFGTLHGSFCSVFCEGSLVCDLFDLRLGFLRCLIDRSLLFVFGFLKLISLFLQGCFQVTLRLGFSLV